jgi:hypothetical protein
MDVDETAEGERHARGAVAYICAQFPELAALLPDRFGLFSRGFSVGDGVSTHPDAVDRSWLSYWGGAPFLKDPAVPEDFFAAGIKNAGGSEYLFAMWRIGGRRFWFMDQYVVFQSDAGNVSQANTRARFQRVLAAWREESGSAAWSGDRKVMR